MAPTHVPPFRNSVAMDPVWPATLLAGARGALYCVGHLPTSSSSSSSSTKAPASSPRFFSFWLEQWHSQLSASSQQVHPIY